VVVEAGHFALILALTVSLVQAAFPFAALYTKDRTLFQPALPAAQVQFIFVMFAFLALTWAYVVSDFSVLNVYQNSHSAKPLIYKISGVWGNHEGSLLLWVLILALFGAALTIFGTNLPMDLRATVLAVQGLLSAAFILFMVLTSNPFARIANAPIEGEGLNPILQDVALAIHPPLLYTGYVGFSIAFSFAVAALILGRVDSAWARWVRPWTLAAWAFLTLGIAIGSWWAYYELGWGGWWFWDPVENASLMPWLAGTALLHSAIVMEKRDSLKSWTILLAILTFALSLMGTFLVRSGVLTSVHAFATDPARGLFILMILGTFTGGALLLYVWRANLLQHGNVFAPISREGGLILNNLFLTASCGVVLVGTLYPLALESVTGQKISVGAPFFNATAVPLFMPLLLAAPVGAFLAWKRGDLAGAVQRLYVAAGISLAVVIGAVALMDGGPVLALLALGLGVWMMAGAVSEIAWRAKAFTAPLPETLRRLQNMKRSQYGTMLGHFGLGVMVVGAVCTSVWLTERLQVVKPGETVELAGYEITFKGVAPEKGPNYSDLVGRFEITRNGAFVAETVASKRRYDAPPQTTSEAGIHATWFGDIYLILGDEVSPGSYSTRMYFHPFVRWIWAGSFIMFFGAALSLSDRRLRIGAPGLAGRFRRRERAVPAE
jgi:cytochrome c-type biogenesis protein CcmF